MGNILPTSGPNCPDSRRVETKYGPIIGRRLLHEGERQVDAFQGIPYAKPPIGDLRFKLPEPHEPWTDVKETKSFGPRSIQKDMFPWTKYQLGPTSEDCLSLNVFTPVWSPPTDNGFAVLVFIHGGAFVSDSCVKYGDIEICKHLVQKDVVVVTLQYRLGYLGFWTTGDEGCPGNLGLWDMTLALQWIKDNISAFNGDPSNITVMGQSAGGASVDLLSISPKSRDLFHKVIPMAGNASADWCLSRNSVEKCRKFAVKQGVQSFFDSSQFMTDVRKLPANVFALGLDEVNGTVPIGPRIDGIFIPKEVIELRKEAPPKPRLIGCCRSEGLLFIMDNPNPLDLNQLEDFIAELITEKEHPFHFKHLRREVLLKVLQMNVPHTAEQAKRACVEIYGDNFLNIACQQAVHDHLQTTDAPLYFYSFDYFNPKMFGLLGSKLAFKDATHCCELPFIFGVGILSSFEYTEDDKKVFDKVVTMWTNFAKYGDPNGPPNSEESDINPEKWLPVDKEHPERHLVIDLDPKMSDIYKDSRPMIYVKARHERNQKEEANLHIPEVKIN